MNSKITRTCFIVALAGSALTACGGGGGGGSNSPPLSNLSSAPGESALVAYSQAGHQYTLTANDSAGNSYSFQLSITPNATPTTFNGASPAYSSVTSSTLEKNGVVVANSIQTDYHLLNPYQPLGYVSSTGTPYAVVTSSGPYPATLTVGSSGPIDDLTLFQDSTMSVTYGDEVGTYSVMANNPSTLYVCLNYVTTVTLQGSFGGLGNNSESDCYTVDASGNVELSYITVSGSGGTYTFK